MKKIINGIKNYFKGVKKKSNVFVGQMGKI